MINKAILIIPTFNTLRELERLVKDIERQSMIPDMLIVDNASTDSTFEYAIKRFSMTLEKEETQRSVYSGVLKGEARVWYLRETRNLGCGPGLREGQIFACALRYEYQILSDSDAYPVSKDLIKELVKNTGRTASVPLNSKIARYFRDGKKQKINSFQFHFLTVTKEMVEKVGYISDKYFIQFDDYDYTVKLAKSFGITQLTNVTFDHSKGLSDIFMAGSNRIYYYNRNVMLYYKDFSRKWMRIKIVLAYCFYGLFFCERKDILKFEYCMLLTIFDGLKGRTGYRAIPNIKQKKLKRVAISKPKHGLYLSTPSEVDSDDLKNFSFDKIEKVNLFYLALQALKHKVLIINDYPTKAEYLPLMFFILMRVLYVYDDGEFYKFVY